MYDSDADSAASAARELTELRWFDPAQIEDAIAAATAQRSTWIEVDPMFPVHVLCDARGTVQILNED